MTTALKRVRGFLWAAGLAVVSVSLAGCGGFDGVELNGKIFDAMGVSGDALSLKKTEPKTQARAPLVLPPDATRLPDPGSVPTPAAVAADPSWPKDREAQRLADAEAKKKAHEQQCRDGNWKQKAHKDEVGTAVGPAGNCSGSIFSVLGGTLFGNSNKE